MKYNKPQHGSPRKKGDLEIFDDNDLYLTYLTLGNVNFAICCSGNSLHLVKGKYDKIYYSTPFWQIFRKELK